MHNSTPAIFLQPRFNLSQLDAVALHLDLKIFAAQKFDVAVGQESAQIAGAIQALAGCGIARRNWRSFFVSSCSYPLASPTPPMYSCPGTHAGHGAKPAFST